MSTKDPKPGDLLGPPKSDKAKAGSALVAVARKKPPVIFLRSWKRWYANDKAGFPKEVAKRLVTAKIAKYRENALARAAKTVASKASSKTKDKASTGKK